MQCIAHKTTTKAADPMSKIELRSYNMSTREPLTPIEFAIRTLGKQTVALAYVRGWVHSAENKTYRPMLASKSA
jgi:hypothetical protein